ncbi:unnamed protein product [Calypogeia fissa]
MSFIQASWSCLHPILNAFEVYAVQGFKVSTTAAEDARALYALQVVLNLTYWTGDPCLLVPFDWLECSNNVFPCITNLSLVNYRFRGTIPLEISNLTALTYLALDNNSFYGSIPDLSSLVHLQSIYLQNNNLSGGIPSFFGSAFLNLTRLDLDNNNFSGTVPSNLNKQ